MISNILRSERAQLVAPLLLTAAVIGGALAFAFS